MKYGICSVSVVPIRFGSSDTSEMVSQLLFGEVYEVLSIKAKWVKIKCSLDGYEGWISKNQHLEISEAAHSRAKKSTDFCLELVEEARTDHFFIPIVLGSTIPEYDGINFSLNGSKFNLSGQVVNSKETPQSPELLMKIAKKYLYAPYLWGGRSPFGIDCSGFVQVVYKMLGFKLERDAKKQVNHGEVVNLIIEARPGDLAFFENTSRKIVHVGIILENQEIIHASGRVRIDNIDHQGIYNRELGAYTHKLRVIKRLLENQ